MLDGRNLWVTLTREQQHWAAARTGVRIDQIPSQRQLGVLQGSQNRRIGEEAALRLQQDHLGAATSAAASAGIQRSLQEGIIRIIGAHPARVGNGTELMSWSYLS